jgi:hypothetical protein
MIGDGPGRPGAARLRSPTMCRSTDEPHDEAGHQPGLGRAPQERPGAVVNPPDIDVDADEAAVEGRAEIPRLR